MRISMFRKIWSMSARAGCFGCIVSPHQAPLVPLQLGSCASIVSGCSLREGFFASQGLFANGGREPDASSFEPANLPLLTPIT